jgi:hypothetical protein
LRPAAEKEREGRREIGRERESGTAEDRGNRLSGAHYEYITGIEANKNVVSKDQE